ncbi:MAG TPA: glycosyltransferase [Gemmatimonadaceae bacterium]|nr:glycosyltransferase [Gemmatimonadaceae bacterium]
MKVLFLTHALDGGDAATPILRLATALRNEGIETHVVAPDAGSELAALDGVGVTRFRRTAGTRARDAVWQARLRALGFLTTEFTSAVGARRAVEPALIHAHGWFPSGLVGTWVSGLARLPLLTSLYDADVRLVRHTAVAKPLFRHVVNHSAATTTVSRRLASLVARAAGGPAPIVAPLPVESAPAHADGPRDTARVVVLGAAGRRGAEAVERALRAVELLGAPVVVEVAARSTAAVPAGADSQVRWLSSEDRGTTLARVRSAGVLIAAGDVDDADPILLEAQLAGTPLVATSPDALGHAVQHERTGLRASADEPEAIAAELRGLRARADRGRSLGEAARMYALAALAPESSARRYAAIYRELLGAGPA